MNGRKTAIFSITVLFFLSAVLMLRQLVTAGYFSCIIEDTYTFTSWTWQFIQVLKEGIIYPRWLPLNFWGYGSPTFILYPPLAFYLVAFFYIFTGSVITAMNITKFLALFLSGTGMYFLVREFYSEKIALLTASFYIVFPYTIFQFYYVGTFASTISFMWFAPILLFTCRFIKQRKYPDIIYVGVCYGGLIMTHLINAYMFTFVLIGFIIYMSIVKKMMRNVLLILLIPIVGFLISAVYILPVLVEKQFVNFRYFVGKSGFHFYKFFILPDLTSKFSPERFWPIYYSTFVFYIFFFCILMLLALPHIFKMRHMEAEEHIYTVNKFFLGTAICTIFLLFGVTTFIWETIPYFQYIQFPHRWLNITAFVVIFLSAAIFWAPGSFLKPEKKYHLFVVLLFLICFLFDYKQISASSVFPERVLMPVKGTNWNYEHMPIWANPEKLHKNDSKKGIEIREGEGKATVVQWKPLERVFRIDAKDPLTVKIPILYFPGWKAYINGKETEIHREEDVGSMLIRIPEGKYILVIRFEDTPIRYYAKFVSVVSLVSMILLVIVSKRMKKK